MLSRQRTLSTMVTLVAIGAFVLCVFWPSSSSAFPRIDISVGGDADGPAQVSSALKILALITVLSLAPAILMLMTCFTRIIIVLSFVRQALGVQAMPPNQVLAGLALILTFFLMSPVAKRVHDEGLEPYMNGKLSEKAAFTAAMVPVREFMFKHTRVKDLEMFVKISEAPAPETPDDIKLSALLPAFVVSELTTAFHMGFLVYIPFLLLDFVIASILMSMGMVMLPPALVSLPLKVMLFVLVDGWHLVIGSLTRSVGL